MPSAMILLGVDLIKPDVAAACRPHRRRDHTPAASRKGPRFSVPVELISGPAVGAALGSRAADTSNGSFGPNLPVPMQGREVWNRRSAADGSRRGVWVKIPRTGSSQWQGRTAELGGLPSFTNPATNG
jgi:hypothetical protein